MKLNSLTLQGFKSFGNRTTLEFSRGVTAIIGPNGSGKSNVIEALKWTSGGGRASEFRAADKTDLIFHGAAGKRSVGLAEVELEFELPSGSLKLYRSLGKDGSTRLRLNGRNARFLDVEDALSGSGLSGRGLAIIGQGEVSQILMADPEKLLEYVAEAAGVARLKGRRDQTSSRLKTATSHLERLQDVLHELAARVTLLQEEARGAKRHAELSAEALTLRFTAASVRVESLKLEIRDLGERRALLQDSLLEGRGRLSQLRGAGKEMNARRDAAEERYRAASAELEFRRGNVRLATERIERVEERKAAHAELTSSLEAEVARLESLQAPEAPTVTPGEAEANARAATAATAAIRTELEAAVDAQSGAVAQLTQAESELEAAERAAAEFRSRSEALSELREKLEEQLATLGADSLASDVVGLEEAAFSGAETLHVAEKNLEGAREELRLAHERHALASAEAVTTLRAAERQRAAFLARRGYAQGPRNALTSGIEGVIGSVADLLKVDDEYQQAIAGALGRRAEYVVVDSARTAEVVLAHVRRAGGFVTLLPLDLVEARGYGSSGELAGAAAVLAAATDVVSTENEYRKIFEWLLGRTLIVTEMSAATELARRYRERPRLVTLAGDLLEPSGAMSGGQRSGSATVVGAAAELEEAEQAAAAAAQAESVALQDLSEQQERVRSLATEVQKLRSESNSLAAKLAEARERYAGHERLRLDVEARLHEVTSSERTLADQPVMSSQALAERRTVVEGLRGASLAASARLSAARTKEGDARVASAAAAQAAQVAAERWAAHREAISTFSGARERLDQLRTELGELAKRGAELAREVTEAGLALDLARNAVPKDLEEEEGQLADARAALARLEADLVNETEAQATRAAELEEANVLAARRETALELASEELSGFPEGLVALEMPERSARSRLRSVEAEILELGAVNHRAATELAEVSERKETLEVEAVQATLAVAELEATLERIDRETTQRLNAAISRLRVAFDRHVRQLFGEGGRGGVEVEYEELRPQGLRIDLQPPGKQTQSLHLLSVGERTMGALAFLFGLMGHEVEGGGLPLAVLDEVDAPLDEANIRRFGAFVKRLTETGTQFILITHQKATFDIADTLYGVTSERGVSRVFSMKRGEAELSAALEGDLTGALG